MADEVLLKRAKVVYDTICKALDSEGWKYSKDEESWDMLDKIVSNLKIDGGLLYTIKLNDITQQLRNVVKNQSATISATIFGDLQMNALNRKLNAMQDAIKEMQGK